MGRGFCNWSQHVLRGDPDPGLRPLTPGPYLYCQPRVLAAGLWTGVSAFTSTSVTGAESGAGRGAATVPSPPCIVKRQVPQGWVGLGWAATRPRPRHWGQASRPRAVCGGRSGADQAGRGRARRCRSRSRARPRWAERGRCRGRVVVARGQATVARTPPTSRGRRLINPEAVKSVARPIPPTASQ